MNNKFNNEKKGEQSTTGEGPYSSTGEKPASAQQHQITAPSISLPKGGGAIKGIGETFQPNPFTGTASLTVPIYTSPGRSDFGPKLSLSYGSGSGNGIFGLGWGLSIPSITRKTEKGLPQYLDHIESDTFILSGAEDLVPALKKQGNDWVPDELDDNTGTYRIKRYRPRTEGLFARIEKWTKKVDGDVHWRSITKENITSVYGYTKGARIADETGQRIFSWLLEQTFDDKGNLIFYEYKKENRIYRSNNEEIEHDVSLFLYEKNRKGAANTYIKKIYYGNVKPVSPGYYQSLDYDKVNDGFYFKVVFDYGEHKKDYENKDEIPELIPGKTWLLRQDPFSSFRPGFEVRTRRLCRHVLMFHHFPDEGLDNALVRSTDFTYEQTPELTRLLSVTQTGYDNGTKKSPPPLEFNYSKAPIDFDNLCIDEPVLEVDPDSLENVPRGLSGPYQLIDLNGEGIAGILTEQAGAWHYKEPLGRVQKGDEKEQLSFAPMVTLAALPSRSSLQTQQIMDLDGNGYKELVQFSEPVPGYVEREEDETWSAFHSFDSLPNIDWQDPNLQFIDLNGDGHADILITGHDHFVWYPSLKKEGFGEARYFPKPKDDEKGPALVFSDGTQSIHLADISGDGLSDLVRIRNRNVEYWPNIGYGRFGAKINMGEPDFAHDIEFRQDRIRLFDTDGSGTADIIYFGTDGTGLFLNQAGNSFRDAIKINKMPVVDNQTGFQVADLHGSGTGCLTWSSPDSDRILYIDLMGGIKPHLLTKTENNLGAETHVTYASSTKFYLKDKKEGKPWITKLPFPVYVVERVEAYDWIGKNRFVTHYAYHHGYFDGIEREFRGFGLVEQWDTEEYSSLTADNTFLAAANIDKASHVPPVKTKTWFHTGAYIKGKKISRQLENEYFREPATTVDQHKAMLLPDTILPPDITFQETPEACRVLRGSILRQEIFTEDGTDKSEYPYTVSERSFTIKHIQPINDNRHAVFFVHPRETINYHYERNPSDPRVNHQLTLQVDKYGNIERNLTIGYPRRSVPERKPEQAETHITLTVNRFENYADQDEWYRVGLPIETRTFEIVKPPRPTVTSTSLELLKFETIRTLTEVLFPPDELNPPAAKTFPYKDWDWRKDQAAIPESKLRLIEHIRTYYRRDNFRGHLDLGQVQSLALPFESYKLAFTPGLLAQVYARGGQDLLPADPADILEGTGGDKGGYVNLDNDGNWWIPSGQIFYHPDADVNDPANTASDELAEAREHFFLPRKYTNPFKHSSIVDYEHDLLVVTTMDALDNSVQAEYDYRVLQPNRIIDPNHNHTVVIFDIHGMVVGTAVQGKTGPGDQTESGDNLNNFEPNLDQSIVDGFYSAANPRVLAPDLLKNATIRIVYDIDRFYNTRQAFPREPEKWEPVYAVTLARELHTSMQGGNTSPIQVSFSYSDGFDREIQKKIQAEDGPLVNGGPIVSLRWVGSGWTIFNNKGKPVRQYEPFFSQLPEKRHRFEFGVTEGVSPILFYDPLERVIAALHPNHTYEKVVFDPWRQTTYDVNDTVTAHDTQTGDPRTDPDIAACVHEFFNTQPANWETWYTQRQGGAMGPREQAAANKAAAHADTPTTAYFDSLGRPFLTVANNKVACPHHDHDGEEDTFQTFIDPDIEGNQRTVRDERKKPDGTKEQRIVMLYDYDMLGNRVHQASMEAGERWMLNDVTGKPIRTWDSRDHIFKTVYDELRRSEYYLIEGAQPVLIERTVYGESRPNPEDNNLRLQAVQLKDQAGIVTSENYDFKGNLLSSHRQLAQAYKTTLNWSAAVPLETPIYTSHTRYDALNRPIQLIAPHSNQPGTKINIIQPGYNDANLLEQVNAWLNQDTEPNNMLDPATANLKAVTNIDYNARGQRILIDYENGVRTTYKYDPLTFRLARILTVRGEKNSADCAPVLDPRTCEDPPDTCARLSSKKCILQNLYYTYDPVGNITHIHDDAQQIIYFKNKIVEPSADYTYDALYRLIEATGREHPGQGGQPVKHSYNDIPRTSPSHPGDGNCMGTYTERYVYDAVGNFLEMQHRNTDPAHFWTRTYAYNEPSQIEPAKQSNRLTSSTVGAAQDTYSDNGDGCDPHGNMLKMTQLQVMQWDFKDQLQMTRRQRVNDNDTEGIKHEGERTWYVYDASGQRVRKVTELANGNLKDERIYLGGFEIYLKNLEPNVRLVRETLHIMDDKQRIALVETRNDVNDGSPKKLIRFQFSNHLGSASLELDDQAQIISYEEYTPYGSTSYQAVRSDIQVPLKRYRYTGKERDEESGLYYYGARYYAPWLGRWTSPDPVSPNNVFVGFSNSPINRIDLDGSVDTPWWITAGEALATAIFPGAALPLQALRNPQEFEQKVRSTIETGSQVLEGVGRYFEARLERQGAAIRSLFTLPTPSIILNTVPEAEVRAAVPILRARDEIKNAQEALDRGDIPTATEQILLARDDTHAQTREVAALLTMRPSGSVRSQLRSGRVPRPKSGGARSTRATGTKEMPQSRSGGQETPLATAKVPPSPPAAAKVPPPIRLSHKPLTYRKGFDIGFENSEKGLELVLGKYPGNVRYVAHTPGTVTLDVPGWTPMYNAGYVRGYLEAGGKIRFTSQTFTGTFGLEARQVLGIPGAQW